MSPTRYGDPDDEPAAATTDPQTHQCRKGWIDRDSDNPVPCLVCKPHLAPGNRVRAVGE